MLSFVILIQDAGQTSASIDLICVGATQQLGLQQEALSILITVHRQLPPLPARGSWTKVAKGTKRMLEHTSRWLLQHLRGFRFRPPGRDTLGTLADWAGRKVGS